MLSSSITANPQSLLFVTFNWLKTIFKTYERKGKFKESFEPQIIVRPLEFKYIQERNPGVNSFFFLNDVWGEDQPMVCVSGGGLQCFKIQALGLKGWEWEVGTERLILSQDAVAVLDSVPVSQREGQKLWEDSWRALLWGSLG